MAATTGRKRTKAKSAKAKRAVTKVAARARTAKRKTTAKKAKTRAGAAKKAVTKKVKAKKVTAKKTVTTRQSARRKAAGFHESWPLARENRQGRGQEDDAKEDDTEKIDGEEGGGSQGGAAAASEGCAQGSSATGAWACKDCGETHREADKSARKGVRTNKSSAAGCRAHAARRSARAGRHAHQEQHQAHRAVPARGRRVAAAHQCSGSAAARIGHAARRHRQGCARGSLQRDIDARGARLPRRAAPPVRCDAPRAAGRAHGAAGALRRRRTAGFPARRPSRVRDDATGRSRRSRPTCSTAASRSPARSTAR